MTCTAAIAEIAANSWAQKFHGQISNQMERDRHFTNRAQHRRDQALDEHRVLLDAIISGNPEKAAKIAFDHVIGARDEALRAITGSGLVVP